MGNGCTRMHNGRLYTAQKIYTKGTPWTKVISGISSTSAVSWPKTYGCIEPSSEQRTPTGTLVTLGLGQDHPHQPIPSAHTDCLPAKPVMWLTMLSKFTCDKSPTTVSSGAVASGSIWAEGLEYSGWETRSVPARRLPGMYPASGLTVVSHVFRLNDDLFLPCLSILPSHYHFVYQ